MKSFLKWLLLASLTIAAAAQNQKISQLAAGSPAQSSDLIPIARSGSNYSLSLTNIFASPPTAGYGSTTAEPVAATTISATSGITATSDGVHAGINSLIGNTTNPSIPSNSFGFLGPPSVSFTSYFLQPPATAPSTADPLLNCPTPSGGISSCSWVAPTVAYTLPAATSSTLGGVEPDGTTITNSSGAISVTYGTATNTAAQGNDSRITGAAPLASPSFTTKITTPLLATTTKCAANGTAASPSAVACSASPSGSFSCDAAATGATCVISTTAVTANSAIFVQPDSSLNSLLTKTCNTTADTGLTAPRVSARSATTSFTR